MKLYLIRHAEQDERECLTERGYDQARRLGNFLRGKGITLMFSSDRQRAKETARTVAGILKIKHIVLDNLEEVGEVRLGESIEEAERRVWRGVLEALKKYRPQESVAFVLHSNLIRHFLARIGFPEYLEREDMAHTGMVILEYDPQKESFRLEQYNITPHLE